MPSPRNRPAPVTAGVAAVLTLLFCTVGGCSTASSDRDPSHAADPGDAVEKKPTSEPVSSPATPRPRAPSPSRAKRPTSPPSTGDASDTQATASVPRERLRISGDAGNHTLPLHDVTCVGTSADHLVVTARPHAPTPEPTEATPAPDEEPSANEPGSRQTTHGSPPPSGPADPVDQRLPHGGSVLEGDDDSALREHQSPDASNFPDHHGPSTPAPQKDAAAGNGSPRSAGGVSGRPAATTPTFYVTFGSGRAERATVTLGPGDDRVWTAANATSLRRAVHLDNGQAQHRVVVDDLTVSDVTSGKRGQVSGTFECDG